MISDYGLHSGVVQDKEKEREKEKQNHVGLGSCIGQNIIVMGQKDNFPRTLNLGQ